MAFTISSRGALALLLAAASVGAEPYSWPPESARRPETPLRLAPFASTGGRWESNVDLKGPAPGLEPVSDWAGTVAAGLEADLTRGRSSAGGGLRWEGVRFSKRKAYDARNGAADADLTWRPGPLWVGAAGRFLDTDDRLITLSAERVNRREWEGRAAAGITREGARPELRLEALRRSYADERFRPLGHRRTVVAPALTWERPGLGKFFWEPAWGLYNGRGRSLRDGSSFQVAAGWSRGGPEDKTEARWTAGVLRRRFDVDGIPEFHGLIGAASMAWRPGPRLTLLGGAAWEAEEALAEPFAGYLRQKRGNAGAEWSLGRRNVLSASFEATWQRYAPVGTSHRRDFVGETSLRLRRLVRRGLTVQAGWSFERRGSNRTQEKYKAQRVSMSIEYRREP